MEIDALQQFAVANFSQYFSVTIDTLTRPSVHFAPLAVAATADGGTIALGHAGTRLNPKLVSFAVLSMFLGLTMNSLITTKPTGEALFAIEVIGLLFWVLYAALVHVFCRLARGHGSFLETVSVTIQIFATLYVVCSVVATALAIIVKLKPVKLFIAGLGGFGEMVADNPVVLFFAVHTILLLIYLPRGLKPVHKFNLFQQIAVALPTGFVILLHGVAMLFVTGTLWAVDPPAHRQHPDNPARRPAVAQADPLRLRVLTLNMDGLRYPPRVAWVADQSACAERFKAVAAQIRNAVPPYDIVALQELYRASDLHIVTCDPAPFVDALGRQGGNSLHRILFTPKGETWKLEADGGIGVITPHVIKASAADRFSGSGGTFLAARGVLYARIGIAPGVQVDTYVVHLSPGRWNREQRRRELEMLSHRIAANSSDTGNPVLVLGDFNIEGPPHAGAEYETILRLLDHPRDLWLENPVSGPAYTYDCFRNAVAALGRCNYQARIDYLWAVTDRRLSRGNYDVTVGPEGVRTIEWRTGRAQPLPVSDHYGVEAFLTLQRNASLLAAR